MERQGQPVQYLLRNWQEIPDGDVLVNLAAYGNYYDQTDVFETYRVNLQETIRLLQEADRFKSIVLVSTSSVLIPHQTPYSLSKKAMEDIGLYYAQELDRPVAIVRPSSVTGRGEQEQHLIPKLIRSCLYGEEIPFVAGPRHDFIDVDDFVSELVFVSQHIDDFTGHTLNLSSGRSYSNQDVLDMVEEITGKKANIKTVDSMRSYDTKDWLVEDSLPNIPKKTLYQSISEMVEHEYQRTSA